MFGSTLTLSTRASELSGFVDTFNKNVPIGQLRVLYYCSSSRGGGGSSARAAMPSWSSLGLLMMLWLHFKQRQEEWDVTTDDLVKPGSAGKAPESLRMTVEAQSQCALIISRYMHIMNNYFFSMIELEEKITTSHVMEYWSAGNTQKCNWSRTSTQIKISFSEDYVIVDNKVHSEFI